MSGLRKMAGSSPIAAGIDLRRRRLAPLAGAAAFALLSVAPDLPAHAATLTTVYTFCSQANCADGAYSRAGLIFVKGTLYGTTAQGGAYGYGAAFSLDPATGAENVLHSFGNGSDGQSPYASLLNVKGMMYGTTVAGGDRGYGTVFSVDPMTGAETVLHSFGKGADGRNPYANLLIVKGKLYGTTANGGVNHGGTIFTIDARNGRETSLYSFGSGQHPYAPLIVDSAGNLYGTTTYGGAMNVGTVFELASDGTQTTLYSFGGGTDGAYPVAGLLDANGALYGTTLDGGAYGLGTVFSLDPVNGKETVLWSFGSGKDGWFPYASVIDVNGTLYGATDNGGSDWGTVFSLDPQSKEETVLADFTQGVLPCAGLINVNGTLYGTTSEGGAYNGGTVFSIAP